MKKIIFLLKKWMDIVKINDVLEQIKGFPGQSAVVIGSDIVGDYINCEVKSNETGVFGLYLKMAGQKRYVVTSFEAMLLDIRNKYGNIKLYVNSGGTFAVKRYNGKRVPYVCLTNRYDDMGYSW